MKFNFIRLCKMLNLNIYDNEIYTLDHYKIYCFDESDPNINHKVVSYQSVPDMPEDVALEYIKKLTPKLTTFDIKKTEKKNDDFTSGIHKKIDEIGGFYEHKENY